MLIYFSGAENEHHLKSLSGTVDNVHISYFDLLERGENSPIDAYDCFTGICLSFGGGKCATAIRNGQYDYDDLVDRYLAFAVSLGDSLKVLIAPETEDTDPEDVEAVIEMADKLGLPIYGLTHPERVARRFFAGDARLAGDVRQDAQDGRRVHLRSVANETVYTWPAHSCDSMEWLAGEMYGQFCLYSGGAIRTLKDSMRTRSRIESEFDKLGLLDDYISEDTETRRAAVNKFNLLNWRAYQDHLLNREPVTAVIPDVIQPDVVHQPEVMPAEEDVATSSEITVSSGGELSSIMASAEGKLPLQCNSCFARFRCPKYQMDSACTITFTDIFDTLPKAQVVDQSIFDMLKLQYERINRAAHFERSGDGYLDLALSEEIGRYFEMLERVKKMGNTHSLTIFASGRAAENLSGGLISKLLGKQ